ncbi:MAG: hypothetical protein Unbinned664contig1000_34 [Prokaryotic dsDNA virus sp.]|nr:MAG: hypothetical protein Unbinned664contig1000_34 [Prokaryotic dsDNA virus sp.]|tara:strand:- start:12583 stop:13107 length:525 start_codon:yes stop_codon:yes gene_type:complete
MPHKVADRAVLTLNLQGYFNGEAEGSPWYAYGETNEGRGLIRHSPDASLPRQEQVTFASELVHFLNKHLALDGAWWILLREMDTERDENLNIHIAYRSFVMIHIDSDGDARFAVESDDQHWVTWLLKGRQYWGEAAHRAWEEAGKFRYDVDAKNLPTIKAALGERSKGPLIPLA